MSLPDDPYAAPPREREPVPGRTPPPRWDPPAGPAADRPPPAPGPGRLGVAALVTGAVSVLLGLTVLGGLVLGTAALVLAARGRARAAGAPAGTALAGGLLGLVGIAIAVGTYTWLQPHLEEYQGCRKESVSLAQDRACEQRLRDSLPGTR